MSSPEKTSQTTPSLTDVNRHGVGVWGGPRVVVGARVDRGLYSAFKPVAKRVFGSVCRALESYMVAVLACSGEAVNFGHTVKIERMNIERNLRPRRKLAYDPCEVKGCKCEAVGDVDYRGTKFRMCDEHMFEYAKLKKMGHVGVKRTRISRHVASIAGL